MSIYKKHEVIKETPARLIVRREAHSYGNAPKAINVSAGEIMVDERMLGGWQFGSAVSYALQNNRDPIAAYENCAGPTHWLNGTASVLSSQPSEKELRILITEDDLICFEGSYFKVLPAPNDNKRLVNVEGSL